VEFLVPYCSEFFVFPSPLQEKRLKYKKYNLDLRRRRWQEAGEDCTVRSFITCMLH
jgi:hypothetical protein